MESGMNDMHYIANKHSYENVPLVSSKTITIRYDTIGDFNVDSEAEYSALSSSAHVARKKYKKKKLIQTKRQYPFNSVDVEIRKGSPDGIRWRKGFVKQISFKSGVKGRGSDRG